MDETKKQKKNSKKSMKHIQLYQMIQKDNNMIHFEVLEVPEILFEVVLIMVE
jgi:hypothetical protein